jgi:predicted exporter
MAAVKRIRPLRLVVLLLVLAFVVAGLSRISFNVNILKLLPSNLPQVQGLSLFLKHFSLPRELIVTLEQPDPDQAEAGANSLATEFRKHPELVQRAVAAPPWEKQPAELAEFLAWTLINQPPAQIRALRDRLSPAHATDTLKATLDQLNNSMDAQQLAMLSYDPYGFSQVLAGSSLMSAGTQSEFTSSDGTFRVLYVDSAKPFANYKDNIAWIGKIKAIANEWNATHHATLGFTGEPAFVADISGSMEWDMMSSGFITMLVISFIFWACYRRHKPLFWLIQMLTLVFLLSLATAGLFLSQLTVIGVGFASIMIGLSVDYGYLIYEKSLRHTGTLRELQWDCLKNIAWTAGTTAAAFFSLNLSSMPGLSQLGNLVGIGVVIGSGVMLLIYAPMAMKWKAVTPAQPFPPSLVERIVHSKYYVRFGTALALIVVVTLLATLLIKGPPALDFSSRTLRPRVSGAYDALDKLYAKLTDDRGLVSLIVTGDSEAQVHERLLRADAELADAKARGDLQNFRSTAVLWPAPDWQRENLATLQSVVADSARLQQTALDNGFTDDAFALTGAVLKQWATWQNQPVPIWPKNDASQWILRRTASYGGGQFAALGVVQPTAGRELALAAEVSGDGIHLASWNLLGDELKRVIPREFQHLILGLVAIVFVILIFGFGSLLDVLLLAATMGLVFLSLAGAMSLLGMTWNFFNLAAILLLLGTGIDYGILLLLALRRNGGDIPQARASLGLVISLCATSAAAGFGTISWANNLGLASLGKTCAIGLVIDALISIFLLPYLWRLSRWILRKQPAAGS